MERSFSFRIKHILQKDTPFRIARAFAMRMLPLSFLAGIFICVAIPSSYYLISKADMAKQAELHADYLASIFKDILEKHPLSWEEEIRSHVGGTGINLVRFFDRRHRLISEISSGRLPPSRSMIKAEKKIDYGARTYGYVSVWMSLAEVQANALKLLLFSLLCGTVEGVLLFLIPVFRIQDVEESVNQSRQELLDKQRRLMISEEKYRSLFELAPDGILISTVNGKILSCNRSFLQMFELNKEELSSLNASELYARGEDRQRIVEELLGQGKVENKEVTLRRSDGRELPALLSMQLIHGKVMAEELGGQQQDMLVETIIRDISAKKEVEKQLLQAQKMESIGLLAGGIAHDFNNILAGILGYSTLILSQAPEESVIHRYAKTIEDSAVRASELTQKLLAFARGGKYNIQTTNLNKIVSEVYSILKRTMEKNINISVRLEEGLRCVEADPSQMSQILLNLCVNARDAMPHGGSLFIETRNADLPEKVFPEGGVNDPGGYVAVSVKDTGTGIDKEVLPRIFEPFFTTKQTGKGTGLGLSMVYGIVKNHGGYIDVESTPGKGTTFTVYLPASRDQRESCTGREEIQVEGGNELILVIDDEEMVADLAREILEEKGYRVLVARDGIEGISLYKEHAGQVDLVLLDMIMPNMDGAQVFKELKRLDPKVKVMLVSGYSLDRKAQDVLARGALAFIKKPYRPFELLKKVRELLGVPDRI